MINPMDLTEKKILLTGATGGIGRVTAHLLADLGAHVYIADVFLEKMVPLMDELGRDRHAGYYINLLELETIEPMVKKLCDERGPMDGFVHCAGVAPMRPLKLTRTDDILWTMKINYLSFMEFVRCLTQRKRFSDGGSIVALSSTGSFHGKPTKAAYSASKASIDASIRCMVCDLKSRRIRINSIAPSWVKTEMYEDFVRNHPESPELKELEERQFMGISDPIEVANVIAFLLSDATKTITGTSIVMDGGILQG